MSIAATATSVAIQSTDQPQEPFINGNPGHWPRDILEAYKRGRGPYTVDNAEVFLEEEAVELFNGWLVWQEMTTPKERRVVANIQTMLDVSARKAGFGQALPDQMECRLSNGDAFKPDASLISWQRLDNDVKPQGPRNRPRLMGGPELVIEARSPSNRRKQERAKRALYMFPEKFCTTSAEERLGQNFSGDLYFKNKVQIVWDVDEVHEVIWVYHATAPDQPLRYGLGDEIICELLPGWRRRVADIFAAHASAEAVVGEVVDVWRDEGAARTLRDVLPMLAQARFGGSPIDLAERLAHCTLAQLQQAQAIIMSSPTLEAWLAALPKGGANAAN